MYKWIYVWIYNNTEIYLNTIFFWKNQLLFNNIEVTRNRSFPSEITLMRSLKDNIMDFVIQMYSGENTIQKQKYWVLVIEKM